MQNTGYTKLLNLEILLNCPALYFPQRLEECFDNIQNLKKLKSEED